jgi:hypothetical protein
MTEIERSELVADKLLEITNTCNSKQELADTLCALGYTIGSMINDFPQDEQNDLMLKVTEMVVRGLVNTNILDSKEYTIKPKER